MGAAENSGKVTLSGTKLRMIDGHTADRALVLAASGTDRYGSYLVDGDAPGLHRSRVETLDLTRPLATLRFDDAAATLLGEPLISSVLGRVNTLFAAEMVGGLRHGAPAVRPADRLVPGDQAPLCRDGRGARRGPGGGAVRGVLRHRPRGGAAGPG
jgi:hypothetical protein